MATEYRNEECPYCKNTQRVSYEYDELGRRGPSRRCTNCDNCLDLDVRFIKGAWELLKSAWSGLKNASAYKKGFDDFMNGEEANCPDFFDSDQQQQYANGYTAAITQLRLELKRKSR